MIVEFIVSIDNDRILSVISLPGCGIKERNTDEKVIVGLRLLSLDDVDTGTIALASGLTAGGGIAGLSGSAGATTALAAGMATLSGGGETTPLSGSGTTGVGVTRIRMRSASLPS